MSNRPPKWADRFLSWFCRDELLEEVRGDLHEFYGIERQEKSRFRANLSYWFHTFHFLRPFAFRRQGQNSNNIVMYKSYLKTGFRNLKRQRLASFINVTGLATTIAIALVVYVMVNREFRLDQFHQDADQIFAVHSAIAWEGSEQTWGRTPLLLGPALKADVPQIEQMVRVDRKPAVVRFGDKVFNESLTLADPDYLSLFTFPLAEGNASALRDKKQVILSEKAALKYFDGEDAIGQDLKVIANDQTYLFTVAGVAAPFPQNASFEFSFLINFDNIEKMYGRAPGEWENVQSNAAHTFIKLDKDTEARFINQRMADYTEVVNEVNRDWPIQAFSLHPLTSLARNTQYIRSPYASGSTPEIMLMFAIISLLLLVSACFNYVNIAVSMAQKRLGEIALRKVVGGHRRQLIAQFLTENYLLCFIATVLGILLAVYFFLPGINAIFPGVGYQINFLENPGMIGFLALLLMLLGLASGAFPAFYVSSFRPIAILGGREKLARKNRISKVFLTSQFFITFVAIISGLLFTNLGKFQAGQDWGYNPDDLLVLPFDNTEQLNQLRQFAEQQPGITNWAASGAHIGLSFKQEVIKLGDDKHTVRSFGVEAGFVEMFDIDVLNGRSFDKNLQSDQTESVLVNKTFARKFDIDLSGQQEVTVAVDGKDLRIIGITEDFHYDDFFNAITPAIMRAVPEEKLSYISFKSVPGGLKDTEILVEAMWKENFPDTPYTGFRQAAVFDGFFRSTNSLKSVMNFVAVVAIILSGMGLFGLASLLILKRMKEYSIRKVLGASAPHIVKLVSAQFIKLMLIALLLGIPVSYFMFNNLFSQVFPDSFGVLTASPFIVAVGIMFLVIMGTISSHIIQLLLMSPVKNLRQE